MIIQSVDLSFYTSFSDESSWYSSFSNNKRQLSFTSLINCKPSKTASAQGKAASQHLHKCTWSILKNDQRFALRFDWISSQSHWRIQGKALFQIVTRGRIRTEILIIAFILSYWSFLLGSSSPYSKKLSDKESRTSHGSIGSAWYSADATSPPSCSSSALWFPDSPRFAVLILPRHSRLPDYKDQAVGPSRYLFVPYNMTVVQGWSGRFRSERLGPYRQAR